MVLGRGQVQLSYAEEESEVVDLAGGTIGTTQVTVLTGLTASKYAGQTMKSLGPGTSRGKEWNVQDNATTSITVEEATLTSDALANSDDVAINLDGVGVTVASVTGWIGIFDKDVLPPDPKFSIHRLRAHGKGRHVADQVDQKWQFHTTLPFIVQDWKFLFFAFGHEHTTGSDKASGGGSDVDEANGTGAGHTHLDVTDATNYTTNDYIQVGTGATAEVRKITAVATNAITLDKFMRHNHADAETCNEVEAPYTHVLRVANRLPTFSIAGAYDEATDETRIYHGGKVKRLTLKSSTEGLLEADMECWFQDVTSSNTKPTITVATTDPYAYHMVDGGVSVNSVTYARINSFECTIDQSLREKYYHCDNSGNKPFEHIEGGCLVDLKINITVTNMNIWDLLFARTEFTITVNFDRTATSDEFTLTFKNCRLSEATHGVPREGEVNVDLVASMHHSGTDLPIEVQVIDSNPYFGFV